MTKDVDELKDPTNPHDANGRAFLARVNKFLVNITGAAIGARAAKCGYTAKEHAEGWQHYNVASGADRPFAHFLSQANQRVADGDERLANTLRQLDAFENLWFPRTRSALRRFVPKAHREAAEAAFFANLKQQDEGPAVAASVGLFLDRLDGLAEAAPGGQEVVDALKARGLTPERIAEMRGLLKTAEELGLAEPPAVDEAAQRAAAERQLAAFEALKGWYNDWATTLSTEFSYHDLVKLGLRTRKGGRVRADNPADGAEDGSDD